MVSRTGKSQEWKTMGLAAVNPIQWLRIAVLGVLLGAIYDSSFIWLVMHDWPRDDYTHCYLIPCIVIYLIWEKRQSLAKIRSVASWVGFGIIVLGLILFWLGELSGELFALYLSSWMVLVGITWALIGWEKLKTILFSLCLLLAAFPLPHFLNNKVTVSLKLISSQLGVAMMRLYGMSAYREGNVIDLGFTQLQVVDACSGLRYLFPLVVLGIILAFLFKAAFWKRAVVVISTVPLSIITNSLRIALTGILYEIWGAEVAEGFFHGFSGWFIFMFSFVALLGEMKVLGFNFSVSDRMGMEVMRALAALVFPRQARLQPQASSLRRARPGSACFILPSSSWPSSSWVGRWPCPKAWSSGKRSP
jgi:exosortase D (VPLPA-CTERM-specific)